MSTVLPQCTHFSLFQSSFNTLPLMSSPVSIFQSSSEPTVKHFSPTLCPLSNILSKSFPLFQRFNTFLLLGWASCQIVQNCAYFILQLTIWLNILSTICEQYKRIGKDCKYWSNVIQDFVNTLLYSRHLFLLSLILWFLHGYLVGTLLISVQCRNPVQCLV